MQYHLSGYRSGDPHTREKSKHLEHESSDILDVLVIGCGPAGLTLAAQMSAFEDIKTRIIEREEKPLELGQADGLACRTLEMFEAFGFSHHVIKEAYNVVETVFWGPSEKQSGHITRTGRIQDVEDDLSEMPHLILNQARVHDRFIQFMRQSSRRLQPEYGCSCVGLDDKSNKEFVAVNLVKHDGSKETIKARYVVGCDGARSTIRKKLGLTLQGDSANQSWGVMDVLLVTDFPDIRFKSVVRSSSQGNALIIPREGGYLVRFYIELNALQPGERVVAGQFEADDLIKAAQRIFRPFTLDIKQVVWWSVYEIGQRLCDRFDNNQRVKTSNTDSANFPRVFIAGDACHTHSPKAGQGMNVGMADSFNLGWKLAVVLRGNAKKDLLNTYSSERHFVARELIEFDRHWAARFSEAADKSRDHSTEFQDYFSKHGKYTAGVAVKYPQSMLVADGKYQALSSGWPLGMRFHSAMVTRVADALPLQLAHTLKADGRWRLFIFASQHDPDDRHSPVWQLCDYLSTDSQSPMRRYQGVEDDPDAVIDLRVIFQKSHRNIDLLGVHPFLKPAKGAFKLVDHEKVFSSETKNGVDIFDKRKVSRQGCMVLVRPDQYVADIMPLDATSRLCGFLERIFLPKEFRN